MRMNDQGPGADQLRMLQRIRTMTTNKTQVRKREKRLSAKDRRTIAERLMANDRLAAGNKRNISDTEEHDGETTGWQARLKVVIRPASRARCRRYGTGVRVGTQTEAEAPPGSANDKGRR